MIELCTFGSAFHIRGLKCSCFDHKLYRPLFYAGTGFSHIILLFFVPCIGKFEAVIEEVFIFIYSTRL